MLGSAPNPFVHQATIRFYLPKESDAALEICTADGRSVWTQQTGECGPGVHGIEWDGSDQTGQPVTSGVYLYTVKVGPHKLTDRLTVLR